MTRQATNTAQRAPIAVYPVIQAHSETRARHRFACLVSATNTVMSAMWCQAQIVVSSRKAAQATVLALARVVARRCQCYYQGVLLMHHSAIAVRHP